MQHERFSRLGKMMPAIGKIESVIMDIVIGKVKPIAINLA
jgi:hypothetical protein